MLWLKAFFTGTAEFYKKIFKTTPNSQNSQFIVLFLYAKSIRQNKKRES
jgi:hypothetical protein